MDAPLLVFAILLVVAVFWLGVKARSDDLAPGVPYVR